MFAVNFKEVRDQGLTLGKEVKLGLKSWSIEYQKQKKDEKPASIKSLFVNKNYRITLIVWYIWFVNNFAYYGIVFLLPRTLNGDSGGGDEEQ